jgi:competence protein ComFC
VPLFNSLVTIGVYNGLLKNLIYRFKYESQKNYTIPLARLLSQKIINEIDLPSINYISCIPLHPEKQKQRGFNQAEMIARQVSRDLGKPFLNIFSRIKNTKPQFSLNIENRADNLKDAFKIISKKPLKDKKIIIVDDIFTTGATIQEACRVLQENSVSEIYVAVLARSLS